MHQPLPVLTFNATYCHLFILIATFTQYLVLAVPRLDWTAMHQPLPVLTFDDLLPLRDTFWHFTQYVILAGARIGLDRHAPALAGVDLY